MPDVSLILCCASVLNSTVRLWSSVSGEYASSSKWNSGDQRRYC